MILSLFVLWISVESPQDGISQHLPPVVVVVVAAPAPLHPIPHHVGDEVAAPGELAAQLRVTAIAKNPECS